MDYKEILKTKYLFPSMRVLLEDSLRELGLKTSKDLYDFLAETEIEGAMTSLKVSE